MQQAFQIAPREIYRAIKPIRSAPYKRWIKRFPCIGCQTTRWIDPMHTGPHGASQKGCDLKVLPGCRKCHELFDADPRGFAEKHGLDIETLIRFFNHLWKLKKERDAR